MNVIEHALKDLRFEIPEEILRDAFIDHRHRTERRSQSLEDAIRRKIIDEMIKPDLDAAGGVLVEVPLHGLPFEKLTNYDRIYRIPKERTLGRAISQYLRVRMNIVSVYSERIPGQSSMTFQVSPYERAIQSVVASNSPLANISNAEIEPLAENVVKIHDYMNFTADMVLECLVSYTRDLTEIKRPYYKDFSELVTTATKAYIYRTLALKLDKTRLDGGRDFGRYKEFVDEWRDSYQMYKDLLNEKWYKILLLNDQNRKEKHIMNTGKLKV